jgi:hypothetical protein
LLLHRQFVAAEVWCGAEDVVAVLLQFPVIPFYPLSLFIRRHLPFFVARAVVQRVVAVRRVVEVQRNKIYSWRDILFSRWR